MLPRHQRRVAILHFGATWPKARFELVDKMIEVAPCEHLASDKADMPCAIAAY